MAKVYAAATLLLATALSVSARAEIVVGPGFDTPCAQGGCPVFSGSVNALGATSLDFYQSTVGPVDTSRVTLIFVVPNNPANALTANPVIDAQLHVPSSNASSTPVTVGGLSAETLMTHGEVYGNLGLLDGNTVGFNQLVAADYALFPATYDATINPIENFSLYTIDLTTSTPFSSGDLINVDFTTLPIGTFALGYATPSLTVTDTSFQQAGVFGLAPINVPEPGTLALLAGFLTLGLVAVKRPG